jgi:hypothetical protein
MDGEGSDRNGRWGLGWRVTLPLGFRSVFDLEGGHVGGGRVGPGFC